MADVTTKLEQRYKQHEEVIQSSSDFLEMLVSSGSSSSPLLVGLGDTTTEAVAKIESKLDDANKKTISSREALVENSAQIEDNIATMLKEIVLILGIEDSGTASPDLDVLIQKMEDLKRQAECKERDCDTLRREIRKVEISKKQRRLQRAIANVKFDLSSTDQKVRGFHKNSSGDLQTFEFDFSKDMPCDVSDTLWDMA